MHPAIKEVIDVRRGCGYRNKTGKLYFFSDGESVHCDALPFLLEVCPACNGGIHPTLGFTWISPRALFQNAACKKVSGNGLCSECPFSNHVSIERAGLLWIGKKYYNSPHDFNEESDRVKFNGERMGISRRVPKNAVPNGFVVGETPVFLAHREAIAHYAIGEGVTFKPGIFRVFVPTRIEVICDGTEEDEVIEGYLKRGLTPVIPRMYEQGALLED